MAIPPAADPLNDFHAPLTVTGPSNITYRNVVHDGKFYQESVGNGSVLESHQLLYGIGSGTHGRSYIFARGDSFFLAPLSYYTPKKAWDLSPGYATGSYRDFLRPVTVSCLFCHSGSPETVAGTDNHYAQPPFRALNISCERCHGPGGAHVRRTLSGIINPAKLSPRLRDDVCNQCHLGGDIRILKPERKEMEFRPGTYLDDVVAIFSVPPTAKPEGLDAVGQAGQLRMSRCWKGSQGKLGCITCHDPHVERSGTDAVAYYRSRCQQCHQSHPCAAPAARRAATLPPNNCITCHMPQNPLNRIAHIAHTNHRILRRAEEALDPSIETAAGPDLTYETARASGQEPDPRTRALAYGEAAKGIPTFTSRAIRLLDDASRTNPRDAELAGAYGLTLRHAGSDRSAQARQFLEKAVELNSQSWEVRMALCEMLSAARDSANAIKQCQAAVDISPYEPAAYIQMIKIYLDQGDRASAAAQAAKLRNFDPANPELPRLTQRIDAPK